MKFPSPDNPVIFKLTKKKLTPVLIDISLRSNPLPKDGTPVEMDLMNGHVVQPGQGNLRVECWAPDATDNRSHHYAWRYRLTVMDGGLLEKSPDLNAEAPVVGYKLADEMSVASDQQPWKDSIEKNYFVKLKNGNYALLDFSISTGSNMFFYTQTYVNPSGGRSLQVGQ